VRHHVAAGVHAVVVAGQGRGQPLGQRVRGALHRPALDQPGGVPAQRAVRVVVRRQLRVEPAAGALPGVLAEPGHLGHVRVAAGQVELAAAEPAQVAVRAVQAEHPVDLAQLVEQLLHRGRGLRRVRLRPAQVDADRHPHDLCDVRASAQRLRRPRPGHIPALSSADCSDWM
jgi:hypothetical protein